MGCIEEKHKFVMKQEEFAYQAHIHEQEALLYQEKCHTKYLVEQYRRHEASLSKELEAQMQAFEKVLAVHKKLFEEFHAKELETQKLKLEEDNHKLPTAHEEFHDKELQEHQEKIELLTAKVMQYKEVERMHIEKDGCKELEKQEAAMEFSYSLNNFVKQSNEWEGDLFEELPFFVKEDNIPDSSLSAVPEQQNGEIVHEVFYIAQNIVIVKKDEEDLEED